MAGRWVNDTLIIQYSGKSMTAVSATPIAVFHQVRVSLLISVLLAPLHGEVDQTHDQRDDQEDRPDHRGL